METGHIYKITNKVNGKIYIGLTTTSVNERWNLHVRLAHRSPSSRGIKSAILKYGPESFTVEQMDSARSIDDLIDLEIEYIKCLRSNDPRFGYNLTPGGETAVGKPVKVSGKKFASLKEACKHHGVGYKMAWARLKKGWTLRQALSLDTPPKERSKTFCVDGMEFDSQADVSRFFGIDPQLISARLKAGWSDRQVVGLDMPPNSFEIEGRVFPSFNDACKNYGLHFSIVRQRMKLGWTVREAFGIDDKPGSFFVGALNFDNLKHALRSLGRNNEYEKINGRLKRGWSHAEAIGIKERIGNGRG